MDDTFVREVRVQLNDENDVELEIHQEKVGDVGCVVWDAALVLAHYLQTKKARNTYIRNKRVIELGAGTGIVGLVAAVCGAEEVFLTDLPSLLPLIQRNIHANRDKLQAPVKSCQLIWGETGDVHKLLSSFQPNCVLVADCVYYKEAVLPLAKSINDIISGSNKDACVLCSYEDRDTSDKTELQKEFRRVLEEDFNLKTRFVPLNEMDEQFRSEDIHIFVISKT